MVLTVGVIFNESLVLCQEKKRQDRSCCSERARNESVLQIKLLWLKGGGRGAVYVIQEAADGEGLLAISSS